MLHSGTFAGSPATPCSCTCLCFTQQSLKAAMLSAQACHVLFKPCPLDPSTSRSFTWWLLLTNELFYTASLSTQGWLIAVLSCSGTISGSQQHQVAACVVAHKKNIFGSNVDLCLVLFRHRPWLPATSSTCTQSSLRTGQSSDASCQA